MKIELTEPERRYLLKLVKKEEQKAIQKITSAELLNKIFGIIDKLSKSC